MRVHEFVRHPAVAIAAAFAAVYVIWGSTYLGIRFAIESLPPFLMAGARWVIAGVLLYAWRRASGDEGPTRLHWRNAAVVGGLLIVGGNGIVSWAEQYVPSSLTALLIAIVPVWIALLEWLRNGVTPTARVAVGIGLGLAGVLLLVGPAAVTAAAGAGFTLLVGVGLILLASFSWANGSLFSRGAARPSSMLLGASMQMIVGGGILVLMGMGSGELSRLDLPAVSARSWLAFGFLTLFGSVVAYSAYVWLLQVVRAEMVATYAFVNPIVAVILGVALAGEEFTTRTAAVTVLIVVAIAIIVTAPKPAARA